MQLVSQAHVGAELPALLRGEAQVTLLVWGVAQVCRQIIEAFRVLACLRSEGRFMRGRCRGERRERSGIEYGETGRGSIDRHRQNFLSGGCRTKVRRRIINEGWKYRCSRRRDVP